MNSITKLRGRVAYGNQIGRNIGFPTANISLPLSFAEPFGVYLAKAYLYGKRYNALVSIGKRPTIREGQPPNAECFLLDFSDDIYGQEIELELIEFLRSEVKFNSIEELKEQITHDLKQAQQLFQNY